MIDTLSIIFFGEIAQTLSCAGTWGDVVLIYDRKTYAFVTSIQMFCTPYVYVSNLLPFRKILHDFVQELAT